MQGGVTVTTVAVGSHGILRQPDDAEHRHAHRAANTTSSTTPTRCRRFTSARPAASPGRWSTSRTRRSARGSRRSTKSCKGFDDTFPPVSGFVLTSVKENSLVDVILTSPRADRAGERDDPGRVDVRPGQGGRVHHRRRPALGERLDRLGRIRPLLQPDGPLVDAADAATRASSPSPPTCKAARRASSSRRSTRTMSFSTTRR